MFTHKKHNQLFYSVVVGIGIVELLVTVICYAIVRPRIPTLDEFKRLLAPKYTSVLDGTPVTAQESVVPQVFGVMIDNHPDARPQAGLGSARIVYEAPAEGGITRFFAIFNAADSVNKIGPVRSARPYFIDWIREYGTAPYVHSGGSPAALDILVHDTRVWDANEFARGDYFWRDKNRFAPHNLYTDSDLMNKLIVKYQSRFEKQDWIGWKFGPMVSPQDTTTSSKISIVYATDYTVSWEYDTISGRYVRSVNGKLFKDDQGTVLTGKNIIVQLVNSKVLDEKGRKEIGTVGTGAGWVLRQGNVLPVTWNKSSPSSRTIFLDADLHEVVLAPGQTWVQVVPKEASVEIGLK